MDPLRADDEWWRSIDHELSEMEDLFTIMRLETRDQAVGKLRVTSDHNGEPRRKWASGAPSWFDEATNCAVISWFLIPFVAGIDQDEIGAALEHGQSLLPSIHTYVRSRELCPDLMTKWGGLCAAAGVLRLLYGSKTDIGRLREAASGAKNNLEAHRRWFAHYATRAKAEFGTNAAALASVEQLIRLIIDPADRKFRVENVQWFEEFFGLGQKDKMKYTGSHDRLTKEFRNLSFKAMRQYVDESTVGLPPLDWELPNPQGTP
jgi:hypothetical protein